MFVKGVFGDIHDDRAVHEVAHPVRAPFGVQCEVPVGPASHMVDEVLEAS